MKFATSLVLALVFAISVQAQDSISERLSKLEATNASISAMLARQQSDITDIKAEVRAVNDKLDALAKSVNPGTTFTASKVDEWGRGAPASFSSVTKSQSASTSYMAPMMYSSGSMSGSCANGQCGASGGGLLRGLFRGRR